MSRLLSFLVLLAFSQCAGPQVGGASPPNGGAEWLGSYSVSDLYSLQTIKVDSDGTYRSKWESCSAFEADGAGVWKSSQDWIEFFPNEGVVSRNLPSGRYWKRVVLGIHCLIPVHQGPKNLEVEFIRDYLSKDSDKEGVELPYRLNPKDAFSADAWGVDG